VKTNLDKYNFDFNTTLIEENKEETIEKEDSKENSD
jgi:hypothetical protein